MVKQRTITSGGDKKILRSWLQNEVTMVMVQCALLRAQRSMAWIEAAGLVRQNYLHTQR